MKSTKSKSKEKDARNQMKRTVVYFDSVAEKKKAQRFAENKFGKNKFSEFIRVAVDNYMKKVDAEIANLELKVNMSKMEEANFQLMKDKQHKNRVIGSLEADNERLGEKIKILEERTQRKKLNKRLVWLLIESDHPIGEDELNEYLGEDETDFKDMSSINQDIDLLMDSGLVTFEKGGWVWINP